MQEELNMRTVKLLTLTTLLFMVACNGQNKDDVSQATETPLKDNIDLAKADTVRLGPEPAWAKPSKLLPVPENTSGLIFFRRNDTKVHLTPKGQSTLQNQRLTLLDSRALEIGNLSLTWNPETGSPILHKLLIHRNGDVIDVLENNSFEVIRREDKLEESILNGFLTAVLRVPDLRVGDDLEWSYTSPTHDPTLGDKSSGMLSLGGAVQSGAYKTSISWEDGQKPIIQPTDDLKILLKESANAVSITLNNPKIIRPPKDAPPRYSWIRILEYSDYENWSEASKQFYSFYKDASKFSKKSDLSKEAKRIAQQNTSDIDRAKSALELVQQQVRYIYVGLNGGNIKPATAEETWARRYGDCKGKSTLLLALLRELDIEAELVLVNNSGLDDGFDTRLPSPALFDHVLINATIDGRLYWLDPTLPDVIEPSLEPIIPYRWVLPLSAEGATLEEIEYDPFAVPQEMGIVEYDSRAGFDQAAKKKRVIVKRGIEGLAEYMQYSALTAEQLKSSFVNAFTGADGWDSVEGVTYKYDKSSQASILTIEGTGLVDWDKESAGRYTLTLPGGGFNPPSRRQRPDDKYDDVPFHNKRSYSCHTTTVRLPEGTEVKNWGYNTTFSNEIFGRRYYRMMHHGDDMSVRMIRSSRVEDEEISVQKATRDNARIEDFDNSKARIEYNRNKIMVPWGTKRPVPATYEIDWTAPNAPCQPGWIQSEPDSGKKKVISKNELQASAKTGDATAQYEFGKFLQKGLIYDTPQEALTWFEKAATQGHKKANFELGRYYAFKETDLKKAAEHLQTSEDFKEGTYLLADMYFKNPKIFTDISEAQIMELYRVSSGNDYRFAQLALAQRYKDGSIVTRNEVEALKWTYIASGYGPASTSPFKAELSDAEIDQAKKKAQDWIKENRK